MFYFSKNNLYLLFFKKNCPYFLYFSNPQILRNKINHGNSIERNIQEFYDSGISIFLWIFSFFFFGTRIFIQTRKYAPHVSLEKVTTGITRTFVKYVHTHEIHEIRSRVTIHIANVPTGSRWNDTSLAGTVSKRATSYWITQRYHTSISVHSDIPHGSHPLLLQKYWGNARSIWKTFTMARQQGWYIDDKDKVLVSTQLRLEFYFYIYVAYMYGYVYCVVESVKRGLWKKCCYNLRDIIKIISYTMSEPNLAIFWITRYISCINWFFVDFYVINFFYLLISLL